MGYFAFERVLTCHNMNWMSSRDNEVYHNPHVSIFHPYASGKIEDFASTGQKE